MKVEIGDTDTNLLLVTGFRDIIVGHIFKDEAVLDLCRNFGNQVPMDAV